MAEHVKQQLATQGIGAGGLSGRPVQRIERRGQNRFGIHAVRHALADRDGVGAAYLGGSVEEHVFLGREVVEERPPAHSGRGHDVLDPGRLEAYLRVFGHGRLIEPAPGGDGPALTGRGPRAALSRGRNDFTSRHLAGYSAITRS